MSASTTRRGLLAGAGGAALACGIATRAIAKVAPSHPDAELLEAAQAWLASDAESERLLNMAEGMPSGSATKKDLFVLAEAAEDKSPYFYDEVFEMQARTIEGVRAKARMLIQYCRGVPESNEEAGVSLARDLLAIGGERVG